MDVFLRLLSFFIWTSRKDNWSKQSKKNNRTDWCHSNLNIAVLGSGCVRLPSASQLPGSLRLYSKLHTKRRWASHSLPSIRPTLYCHDQTNLPGGSHHTNTVTSSLRTLWLPTAVGRQTLTLLSGTRLDILTNIQHYLMLNVLSTEMKLGPLKLQNSTTTLESRRIHQNLTFISTWDWELPFWWFFCSV